MYVKQTKKNIYSKIIQATEAFALLPEIIQKNSCSR